MKDEIILAYIKKNLRKKRYEHSLRVSDCCRELAKLYGADMEQAALAGLVHDCVRENTRAELEEMIQKEGLQLPEESYQVEELLHGPAAVYICHQMFGIEDQEILNAVQFHTTGRKHMTLLDKILFTADFIEPGRKFAGVEAVRRVAYQDLDKAVIMSLDSSISYLLQSGGIIHPDSIFARNDLIGGRIHG